MRKAGIGIVAVAIVAVTAGFAATSFGERLIGLRTVERQGAIAADMSFAGGGASKAGARQGKVLYGSATVKVPIGDSTVTLRKCPRKAHIINGTLGALHGQQAKYLTIRGFGVADKDAKTWFVDVNNSSDTVNPPGFDVNAIGFIVCER